MTAATDCDDPLALARFADDGGPDPDALLRDRLARVAELVRADQRRRDARTCRVFGAHPAAEKIGAGGDHG